MSKKAVVAPTEAPSGLRLDCPIFPVQVSESQCIEQTRILRRNLEKCTISQCTSPQRRCRVCVADGHWQGSDAVVVNYQAGLCAFHAKHGAEAKKPAPTNGGVVSSMSAPGVVEKDAMKEMLDGSRLQVIRAREIRRNPNQPRKHFDPDDLELLGYSIMDIGLLQSIIVRVVKDDPIHKYELVDGERRWRAAKAVGLEYLRAVIVPVKDDDHQFEYSAAANFVRADHTELEEANAIKRIMETRGKQEWQVARAFGKTLKWVQDRLKLLKLDQRVQDLMAPTRKGRDRLSAAVALYLTELSPQLQVELATEITSERLKASKALHLIRQRANEVGERAGSRERPRKPVDDLKNFLRYLRHTEDGADRVLEAPDRMLTEMFKHQSPLRLDEAMKLLEGNIERLMKLRDAMNRVGGRHVVDRT